MSSYQTENKHKLKNVYVIELSEILLIMSVLTLKTDVILDLFCFTWNDSLMNLMMKFVLIKFSLPIVRFKFYSNVISWQL